MSDHYYSKQPQSKSKPYTFSETLRGEMFQFTSDTGVFSKGEVDFGSRLLIEEFEDPQVQGDLLDVGCGYGPIGITLARTHPEKHVWMIDVNERALALTKENATKNNVGNITIVESDRLEAVKDQSFAAILTNPPIRAGKDVVHGIFSSSAAILCSKGELWVVIRKKQGAPSAEKKLRTLFERVEVVAREKGYYILRAVKA